MNRLKVTESTDLIEMTNSQRKIADMIFSVVASELAAQGYNPGDPAIGWSLVAMLGAYYRETGCDQEYRRVFTRLIEAQFNLEESESRMCGSD
jgi:hypothetical protein